jgi:hypothetical protein
VRTYVSSIAFIPYNIVSALTLTVAHAVALKPTSLLSLVDVCQTFSELGDQASEIWDSMEKVMNTKDEYKDLLKSSRQIEEVLLGATNPPIQLSLLEREQKDAVVTYA